MCGEITGMALWEDFYGNERTPKPQCRQNLGALAWNYTANWFQSGDVFWQQGVGCLPVMAAFATRYTGFIRLLFEAANEKFAAFDSMNKELSPWNIGTSIINIYFYICSFLLFYLNFVFAWKHCSKDLCAFWTETRSVGLKHCVFQFCMI